MKVLFKFENGTEVSVAPENLAISNTSPSAATIAYRTDNGNVPLFSFPGQFFTDKELAERDAKVAAEAITKLTAAAAGTAAVPAPEAPVA